MGSTSGDPGEDAARHVHGVDPPRAQQVDRLARAHPGLAVDVDPGAGRETRHRRTGTHVAHGQPGIAGQRHDRPLPLLADVEQHGPRPVDLAGPEQRAELADVDARPRHRAALPAPSSASSTSAGMPVAHPSGRVGVGARAAHPASGIGGDGQGVPGLAQRVVHEQPAHQRLPDAGDELDRLGRHHRPDARAHRAEHAAHGARRHGIRRRLVREDAGVAGPLAGPPHRDLAVEAVDRPPHVRHAEPGAGVADQVAGREVVGAVEHEVVVGDHRERGRLVEPLAVLHDLGVGLMACTASRRRLGLGAARRRRRRAPPGAAGWWCRRRRRRPPRWCRPRRRRGRAARATRAPRHRRRAPGRRAAGAARRCRRRAAAGGGRSGCARPG